MATIIDGRKTAQKINAHTKSAVQTLKAEGVIPKLAVIMVGNDRANLLYVHMKDRKAKQLGLSSFVNHLPSSITQAKLVQIIHQYNDDDQIDGILVQSPLPKHINERQVDYEIDPEKDVDGFTPENMGKLLLNEAGFYPTSCTAQGIMTLLNRYHVNLRGKKAVIIGSSQIVGRPLLGLMLNAGATVSILNIDTPDIYEYTKRADVIVSATGQAHLINGKDVKKGSVIIDVGENHDENGKLVGDVDFKSASQVADKITPVPGGVGPMTISILMRQTVRLCQHRQNK